MNIAFPINAKWIWYTGTPTPDTYGDFQEYFSYHGGNVCLRISCDSDYVLFINGSYVASNQFGDFDHYKIYDELDITPYLCADCNKLEVLVWHFGVGSSRYAPGQASVLYEVTCEGQVLCASGTQTLCRQNPNYQNGYRKIITGQLGFSFLYDASREPTPYHEAVVLERNCPLFPRPIAKHQLLSPVTPVILTHSPCHWLFDLGCETVGLPVLRFTTDTRQKITVTWGEHLDDGCVRRTVGGRDFSFEYIAAAGINDYTNYMLRLGCRYLEVFTEAPVENLTATVIPQVYPVTLLPNPHQDPLDRWIYDVSCRTLQLCMMEHYVDTPWREQSLYVLDSRNQMLCGYKVFENGNREYVRANLQLISKDRRPDGLLNITYPSGSPLAIPSFSLHYFTAIREYLDHTGDLSLGYEVYDKLCSLLDVFKAQIHDGLVYAFRGNSHWNFYDWSDHMNSPVGKPLHNSDLMINSLFLIALAQMEVICQKIDRPNPCAGLAETLKPNVKKAFFQEDTGLCSMYPDGTGLTELGNSVAILAGLTSEEETAHIAAKIMSGSLCECSLSTKCFKYDALLKANPQNKEAIVAEIRRTYKIMQDYGATSVWETIDGGAAFGNAGSLSHAWSSIPVLYL